MDITELVELDKALDKLFSKVLRERFPWVPLSIWPSNDDQGEIYPWAPSNLTLQIIKFDEGVWLVHSCLEATKAEVDILRRSAALYHSKVGALEVILITMAIEEEAIFKAHSYGFDVYCNSTQRVPVTIPKSMLEGLPPLPSTGSGPLPTSASAPLTASSGQIYSISRSQTIKAEGSPHRDSFGSNSPGPGSGFLDESVISDSPARSLDSSLLAGSTSARLSSRFASSPIVVEQDSPMRQLMEAAKLDKPLIDTYIDLLTKEKIVIPADPLNPANASKIPWEKIKNTPNIKLGHIQKMMKAAGVK